MRQRDRREGRDGGRDKPYLPSFTSSACNLFKCSPVASAPRLMWRTLVMRSTTSGRRLSSDWREGGREGGREAVGEGEYQYAAATIKGGHTYTLHTFLAGDENDKPPPPPPPPPLPPSLPPPPTSIPSPTNRRTNPPPLPPSLPPPISTPPISKKERILPEPNFSRRDSRREQTAASAS